MSIFNGISLKAGTLILLGEEGEPLHVSIPVVEDCESMNCAPQCHSKDIITSCMSSACGTLCDGHQLIKEEPNLTTRLKWRMSGGLSLIPLL